MRLHTAKFDLDRLVLFYITDIHLGSKYCDEDLLKEFLDSAMEDPRAYVIDGGDLLETATKDSVGASVFEEDEMVQEQLEHAVKLYKQLRDEGEL